MDRVVSGWLFTLVLAFLAGWKTAGWQRDSIDLTVSKAATATGERLADIAGISGRRLEDKLEA
ncbi:hypothetical protein QD866_004527, partial [Salmonella enterica]|nr:hypothetical protein [Salmonella enterica]